MSPSARPAQEDRPKRRRPVGGVSPRPKAPAARDLETVVKPARPKRAAGAFPGFSYHGGPVIALPQVSASFWGAAWQGDAAQSARSVRLVQFLTDLIASKFMNVLSQYGAGAGAGSGKFVRETLLSNVAQNLTDTGIQKTIQNSINTGMLSEPEANSCLMIFLADGIGVNDPADQIVLCEPTNDNAFGYHSFFTTSAGHPFYYAIIPGLTDTCLSESCPGNDAGCSLHLAETQEQRQTQVASHEFAEMITDPQLNAWFDDKNGEIGDVCNGESATISVGGRIWTVQRQYSKTDDEASNGATPCVAEAPNPLPKLSPGPSPAARLKRR